MSEHYNTILAAVDGSKEAEWAFNKARTIAKNNNAKLILAHIIDTRSYPIIEEYDTTIRDRSETFANDLVKKYKEQAEAAGIANIETEIVFGSPKAQLSKELPKKHNVDLIVCGSTGQNVVERFLIGSVSAAIVRHSRCDVDIVRTND
ncbi:universal stress protein [Peribacillus sp. Hz7]|uniref:universal stress protein n=1 Tax=Peribacillus sp. Hz7 TaxID=3344873 RepID=UPI0035CA2D81